MLDTELTAKICYEVNKAFCEANNDFSHLPRSLAPEWQKESAIAGVKAHIESDFKMQPEDSHVSWLKQKTSEGWKFGTAKCAIAKTHPCCVPYNELPKAQQTKDFLFRAVVHAVHKPTV